MMSATVVRRAYAPSYEDRIAFMKRFISPCLDKTSRVLDAGCGRQNSLIDPTGVRELIGVDRDLHAIRENRSISRGIVADLEKQDIDVGENVDFVMCVDVAEHLSDPPSFLANVAKILKVGGYFFMAAPNRTCMAGISLSLLPIRTIKFLSRLIEGRETPNQAHYYRLNTISSIGGGLRNAGFDDLRFVLFSPRMGRRGSLRRLLLFPDYVIGRTGLIKHYSLQILCLARLAVPPLDSGMKMNLEQRPGRQGTSMITREPRRLHTMSSVS
jgi:SAM-dependent methyltransferase